MQIRNLRPYAVYIAHPDYPEFPDVEPGDTTEVPDELGASLIEQVDNWEEVTGGGTSVSDVLAHVDGDSDRARAALAVEHAADKPRKSLISKLEEIVGSSEENV